jgi:hypothetical protein
MTVKELIEALQKANQDETVFVSLDGGFIDIERVDLEGGCVSLEIE